MKAITNIFLVNEPSAYYVVSRLFHKCAQDTNSMIQLRKLNPGEFIQLIHYQTAKCSGAGFQT